MGKINPGNAGSHSGIPVVDIAMDWAVFSCVPWILDGTLVWFGLALSVTLVKPRRTDRKPRRTDRKLRPCQRKPNKVAFQF